MHKDTMYIFIFIIHRPTPTLIIGVITIVSLILVFIVIIDLITGAEPGPRFSMWKRKSFFILSVPDCNSISEDLKLLQKRIIYNQTFCITAHNIIRHSKTNHVSGQLSNLKSFAHLSSMPKILLCIASGQYLLGQLGSSSGLNNCASVLAHYFVLHYSCA